MNYFILLSQTHLKCFSSEVCQLLVRRPQAVYKFLKAINFKISNQPSIPVSDHSYARHFI